MSDEYQKAMYDSYKRGMCRKCLKRIDPRQYLYKKGDDYYHECCKPEGSVKVR